MCPPMRPSSGRPPVLLGKELAAGAPHSGLRNVALAFHSGCCVASTATSFTDAAFTPASFHALCAAALPAAGALALHVAAGSHLAPHFAACVRECAGLAPWVFLDRARVVGSVEGLLVELALSAAAPAGAAADDGGGGEARAASRR